MLPSRGLLRSGPNLGLARVRSVPSPRASSVRQFGTNLRSSPVARLTTPRSSLSSTRIGAGVIFGATSQSSLSSRLQARYASTTPEAAPSAAPVTPPVTPPVTGAELPEITGDISTPLNLSGSDLLNMPETMGFLKSFGLDYGWGVTSLMQWYVEHIYVWTGMPWWATIGVAALGLRLAIFKPSLDALVQQQKMNDLRKHPRFSQLEADFKVKMATGAGFTDGAHIQQEMTMIRKSQGIVIWKTLIPMVNIPISFGMFRLFRGMAALPVPSLETGGCLWFPDLAQSDPFFIMPVLTGLMVWKGMTMALPYMAPSQQKTMKMVAMVLMPVSLIFTVKLSAATQLYFLISASLHTLQSWLFYQPSFRAIWGLGPPPSPGPSPAAKSNTVSWQPARNQTIDTTATAVKEDDSYTSHITNSLKGAKESISSTVAARAEQADKKAAAQRAKEYEEKRALEEKEKAIARREYKRMKKEQR